MLAENPLGNGGLVEVENNGVRDIQINNSMPVSWLKIQTLILNIRYPVIINLFIGSGNNEGLLSVKNCFRCTVNRTHKDHCPGGRCTIAGGTHNKH